MASFATPATNVSEGKNTRIVMAMPQEREMKVNIIASHVLEEYAKDNHYKADEQNFELCHTLLEAGVTKTGSYIHSQKDDNSHRHITARIIYSIGGNIEALRNTKQQPTTILHHTNLSNTM